MILTSQKNSMSVRSKVNAVTLEFFNIYLLIVIPLTPLAVQFVFITIAIIIIPRVIVRDILLGRAYILRLLRSVLLPNIGEISIRVL